MRNNFDDFDKEFNKGARRLFGAGCLMMIINAILSIGVVVGIVYGIVWVLQHFGIL